MIRTSTNTNMGLSVRLISLLTSIALHAAVLASATHLIGETGTGPAESSSTLHVSVERLEPADDSPRDNPDLGKLEQQPVQSEPSQELLKFQSVSTKSLAEKEQKNIQSQRISSLGQTASIRKGSDVKERKPMQIASTGQDVRPSRDYQSTLQRLIEKHKYYPLRARRNGQEGTSTVAFTINKMGNISSIRLARSSGTKLLDEAAVQTIIRIGKAPPLPDGRIKWKFMVPVAFNLK